MKCASEFLGTNPTQWVVVEFDGGKEYFAPVEFSNGRCYVGDYTGEEILNYLNRNGENFSEVILNP
jgi:hypothetical protein